MRIVTYELDGHRRCGVVEDGAVHPLPEGTGPLTALGARPMGPAVPLADVRLLPPLEPPTVRDFVTFEEHVEGVRRSVDGVGGVPDAWYDAPTFYFTNPHALYGPGAVSYTHLTLPTNREV